MVDACHEFTHYDTYICVIYIHMCTRVGRISQLNYIIKCWVYMITVIGMSTSDEYFTYNHTQIMSTFESTRA